MEKRARIKIYGVVQGVFFRANAKEKADALSLKGFVKNEKDGGVLAVVEGEKNKVFDFIKWCFEGPPSAVVEKVEIDFEEPQGEFENFEIRYF